METNDTNNSVSNEKQHYNKKAEHTLLRIRKGEGQQVYEQHQHEIIQSIYRQPYLTWLDTIRTLHAGDGTLRILDYCSGQGMHTITIQKNRPQDQITAIDISDISVEVARQLSDKVLTGKSPDYLVMDAHQLKFKDDYFDCISGFGSLSSLDFDTALEEILRVLKPGGSFLAVETLGHNPLINFKRRLNVLRGSRTKWAADHILTMNQLNTVRTNFSEIETHFFGLTTLILGLFPFRVLPLLSLFEQIDKLILKYIRFVRRFAFKVVFIAQK